MKRAIFIVIALLVICFALVACGGESQPPGPSPDQTTPSSSSSTPSQGQSTPLPNVNGTYSGNYSFGSDSGNMSLSIGGQDGGSSFSGQVELDLSTGGAICYSTNVNIVVGSTNVDQGGDISFEAYCGPDNPYLFFSGNAQGGGWTGSFHDKNDNNNNGQWTVTPSSS